MNRMQSMVAEIFEDEIYTGTWITLPDIGKQVRERLGEELFTDEYVKNVLELRRKELEGDLVVRNLNHVPEYAFYDDVYEEDEEDDEYDEVSELRSRVQVETVSPKHVRITVRL